MTTIRIYSGVRSPYSRLGMHVIKRSGLKVDVIPFTGPPGDVPFSNPTDNPLKLGYIMADAPRMAKRLGLTMTMPKVFNANFKPANLAQMAATRDGAGIEFACAIADARWSDGLDIGDLSVLQECAEQAGWSSEALLASVEAGVTPEFEKHRDLIAQDGVFGVPFGVIEKDGATHKYWGHERLELLVEDFA